MSRTAACELRTSTVTTGSTVAFPAVRSAPYAVGATSAAMTQSRVAHHAAAWEHDPDERQERPEPECGERHRRQANNEKRRQRSVRRLAAAFGDDRAGQPLEPEAEQRRKRHHREVGPHEVGCVPRRRRWRATRGTTRHEQQRRELRATASWPADHRKVWNVAASLGVVRTRSSTLPHHDAADGACDDARGRAPGSGGAGRTPRTGASGASRPQSPAYGYFTCAQPVRPGRTRWRIR